jgi:hypothetical protein
MTYKQLIEELTKIPADRLDDTVTVYDPDRDDFCGVNHSEVAKEEENDVLDPGHFYLVLKSFGF